MKKNSIQGGFYVTLYINEPLEGIIVTDTDSKVHYELATDAFCDKNDLAGLNDD